MTVYTVHAPPIRAGEAASDPLAMVFVKDGLCWPALFVPLPWMLFRRLWIPAAAYLALAVGFALLLVADRGIAALALGLAVTLGLWLEGNSIRRFVLAMRGYRDEGVVEARSRSEAEIRFFHGRPDLGRPDLGGADFIDIAPVSPMQRPAGRQDVIGLFPSVEGTR